MCSAPKPLTVCPSVCCIEAECTWSEPLISIGAVWPGVGIVWFWNTLLFMVLLVLQGNETKFVQEPTLVFLIGKLH